MNNGSDLTGNRSAVMLRPTLNDPMEHEFQTKMVATIASAHDVLAVTGLVLLVHILSVVFARIARWLRVRFSAVRCVCVHVCSWVWSLPTGISRDRSERDGAANTHNAT